MATLNKLLIYIGCSGYVYRHRRGVFYPQDLPAKRWLSYYLWFFSTVEINNNHYMLPAEKTFVYVRFYGTGPQMYYHRYSQDELRY